MSNTDTDELEALFDSIVAERSTNEDSAPSGVAEAKPAEKDASPTEGDIYSRLGHLTRSLHEMMRELGHDKAIEKAADFIPDARSRLGYIASMTQQAAERVLNATDKAQPLQDALADEASGLAGRWKDVDDQSLDLDGFRALVKDTRSYLESVSPRSQEIGAQIMEIMMAQDFQDLTGQVIKKITDIANDVESQLLRMLVDAAPTEKKESLGQDLLNGPVINPEGRTDVVTDQGQVDDLLASLGF